MLLHIDRELHEGGIPIREDIIGKCKNDIINK